MGIEPSSCNHDNSQTLLSWALCWQ